MKTDIAGMIRGNRFKGLGRLKIAGSDLTTHGLFRKLLSLFQYSWKAGSIGIHHHPIGLDHMGDIVGRAQPPFNLKRRNTRFSEPVHGLKPAQIIHGEEIAALAAGRFFGASHSTLDPTFGPPGVLTPAGLDAATAQAALAAEKRGKETETRIGKAHGPMNKDLDLGLGLFTDGTDLFEGQLTGEHHSLKTHIGKGAHRIRIMGGHEG